MHNTQKILLGRLRKINRYQYSKQICAPFEDAWIINTTQNDKLPWGTAPASSANVENFYEMYKVALM